MRVVQLMGSFIPGALNGWLLYYIYSKDIGLAQSMIILQILVCCPYRMLIVTLQHVYPPVGAQPAVSVTALLSRWHPVSDRCNRSLSFSSTHYCHFW